MDEASFKAATGRRLDAARIALGRTAAEAAAMMGVSRPTYSDYVGGKILPPPFKLQPFVELGISLDFLYYGIKTALPMGLVDRLAEAETEASSDAQPGPRRGRPRLVKG